jgi:hypothetical protein
MHGAPKRGSDIDAPKDVYSTTFPKPTCQVSLGSIHLETEELQVADHLCCVLSWHNDVIAKHRREAVLVLRHNGPNERSK